MGILPYIMKPQPAGFDFPFLDDTLDHHCQVLWINVCIDTFLTKYDIMTYSSVLLLSGVNTLCINHKAELIWVSFMSSII